MAADLVRQIEAHHLSRHRLIGLLGQPDDEPPVRRRPTLDWKIGRCGGEEPVPNFATLHVEFDEGGRARRVKIWCGD